MGAKKTQSQGIGSYGWHLLPLQVYATRMSKNYQIKESYRSRVDMWIQNIEMCQWRLHGRNSN